ncbi:MAG TPA: hypothetical protein VHU23_07255 [Rhizomicrobium sp.]|jgi:heme/copper-type cytochrome/quinol oxidase subunit 1|nr:hypothetical protein [Rhizomicrobium sp.]
MRPRELFGVGVRLLAVWFWTLAAYNGFWCMLKSLGNGAANSQLTIRQEISFMIFYVLVGVFLMSGARGLIWLAYSDDLKDSTDAPAVSNSSN